MGRLLEKRFAITGLLKASTPVHVGGAGDDLVVDMPLARDGRGRVYIPGTSLAGPIRAWWGRVFNEEEAQLLFGRTPDRSDDREGHASYVRIEDAPAANSVPIEEIRDGVGIDRVSGTAAEGIKYDRAVAVRDASFSFRMEIDVPASVDLSGNPRWTEAAATVNAVAASLADPASRFGALIKALERGDIRFGAAKTRGLGQLTLDEVKIHEQRLNAKNDVLALVRGSAPAAAGRNLHDDWIGKAAAASNRIIEITIAWRPKLPVMSKSGIGGLLVDMLPFVTMVGNDVVPVLAGSSIKGALRSHAERIWRTLADKDAPEDGVEKKRFIRQLEQAELPNLLFGAVANNRPVKNDGRTEGDQPIRPGLGAVYVEDCEIGARIPRVVWDELISKAPGDKAKRLSEALGIVSGSPWNNAALPIAHAAIDRWTGGAADTALFTALELKAAGPHTIRISTDLDRIACEQDSKEPLFCPEEPKAPDEQTSAKAKAEYQRRQAAYEEQRSRRIEERRLSREAALALLFFTLRDLAEGQVPLGFGVNRGLGSLDVADITIAGPLPGAEGESSFSLIGAPAEDAACRKVLEALDSAWRQYWDKQTGSGKAEDKRA